MAGREPMDDELLRWFSGERSSLRAPANLWDRLEPRLGPQDRRPGWKQLFGFRFAFVRMTGRLVASAAVLGMIVGGSAIYVAVSDSFNLGNKAEDASLGATSPTSTPVPIPGLQGPAGAQGPAGPSGQTWSGRRDSLALALRGYLAGSIEDTTNIPPAAIVTSHGVIQPGKPLTREQAEALLPQFAPPGGYGMSPEQQAQLLEKLMSPDWHTLLTDPNRPLDLTYFYDYGINPFVDTLEARFSTFAMDVDTAAYTVARNYINSGRIPPPASVRPEEYINFFDQRYAPPEDTFGIHVDGARSPYGNGSTHLLRIGVNAKDVAPAARRPANIALVIDTSGSMERDNRIALVQIGVEALLDELREGDTVSVVTYSDTAQVLLQPTSDFTLVRAVVSDLRPHGSTNAEAGLRLGFSMAEQAFGENKSNHVILLSDGVANVGQTGPGNLIDEIKARARDGISLSTVGVGLGNYNDVLLERLANDGDGSYAYIDTAGEARRVLGANITGLLEIVAEEAKVQVEFHPVRVQSYRLIGYENRALKAEDFRDDSVDAGEVGAGHTVTAVYELRLNPEDIGGPVGTVSIRWRDPDTGAVSEKSREITSSDFEGRPFDEASPQFRFTASVTALAEVLRRSPWFAGVTVEDILRTLSPAVDGMGAGPESDEAELLSLVRKLAELGPLTGAQ